MRLPAAMGVVPMPMGPKLIVVAPTFTVPLPG